MRYVVTVDQEALPVQSVIQVHIGFAVSDDFLSSILFSLSSENF